MLLWDEFKSEVKSCCQRWEAATRASEMSYRSGLLKQRKALLQSDTLCARDERLYDEVSQSLRQLNNSVVYDFHLQDKYSVYNHYNTASPVFYRAVRDKRACNNITMLRVNGRVSSDTTEISAAIRDYFADIYKRKQVVVEPSHFWTNVPTLSALDCELCDSDFSVDEFTSVVKQLKCGKVPGLDGLSVDFYKKFWEHISSFYIDVLRYAFSQGTLPTSMRRAVIVLLPKTGDRLNISNWRPISLLNVDYKILGKMLANRLSRVLPNILYYSQTYAIPGRSIFQNLHTLRDCIVYANRKNIPLGVTSIDQRKAFDSLSSVHSNCSFQVWLW